MDDKTPITAKEADAIVALAKCTFQPGSYAKRFVGDMLIQYRKVEKLEDMTITEKQRQFLHDLGWKYRKQCQRFAFYPPAEWQGEKKVYNQGDQDKLDAWKKAVE